MSLSLRRIVAAVVIGTPMLFVSTTLPASAGSVDYSDPGVLGTANGWASQLTFSDPAVTATVSVTNTSYKASLGDSTCMTTDPCGWWSVDDESGNQTSDTPGAGSASLSNSSGAYTPSGVKDVEGVTWTWRSPLCNGNFPTTSSPNKTCSNVSTVTIDFSKEVSNAIIHLNNLGGNGNRPDYSPRKAASFTIGYDMTLFSKWRLASGQQMMLLSGDATTNFSLSGNTIKNRFTPQGLGARRSTSESSYDDPSTFYDNGTGSGSVLVIGTYSQLVFEIDLGWSLVNYADGTPVDDDIPEGVSLQISFYDGPIPGSAGDFDDYQLPTVQQPDEQLPSTGTDVSPILFTAMTCTALGFAMRLLARLRRSRLC